MERIGVLGLGSMGKPMARNLLKAGYGVNVLTRTRTKVEDVLSLGRNRLKPMERVTRFSGFSPRLPPNFIRGQKPAAD